MASSRPSLTERLANALPDGITITVYHLSSPPTGCAAIFAAPPGRKPEKTFCESHFLTVAIVPPDASDAIKLLVYAVEVLVYTTRNRTTLFVSKADSTGYIHLLKSPKTSASPLKTITATFLSYLVETRRRPSVPLTISLFARAQDQYLFPGSIENNGKHVLDDRGLVKWWCRVLDPVLRLHYSAKEWDLLSSSAKTAERATEAKAYLVVPGFDKYETRSFFPSSVKTDESDTDRWCSGDPLEQISDWRSGPTRSLIPNFPDDPKARFLDELDEEIPDAAAIQKITDSPSKRKDAGQWKSVRSLRQFWDMMAFRQECSSGRLVGFIWVVVTPHDSFNGSPEQKNGNGTKGTAKKYDSDQAMAMLERALAKRDTDDAAAKNAARDKSSRAKGQKLTGRIKPRSPRIKGSSQAFQRRDPKHRLKESSYYLWPPSSRGEVVVPEKDYKRLNDLLLRLDFATEAISLQSSKRWIDEVAVVAGLAGGGAAWGRTVVGKRKHDAQKSEPTDAGVRSLDAGLIKKRKNSTTNTRASAEPVANILGAGLVRKKPKVGDPAARIPTSSEAGVNVLSAGLVRKMSKPAQ
ncbi:MAG: hypothetical protein M1819_006052 [Sarea resinae]|nr:MAG: hypothetical protein M1819_006052 [Sarea resinae]